eukprot:scaffold147339_cov35-Prasinocladus_malaysianus.AAC.3
MPIPTAEKERMRGELRRMLNRKTNKNRLHLMQKNEDLYEMAMPLLAALEKKLGVELDSIKRGFCINEVRMSAKRAANKADKYGAPPVPEKAKKPAKQPRASKAAAANSALANAPTAAQLASLPSLPPMPSLPPGMQGLTSQASLAPQGSGMPQINAMLDVLGSTFGLPGGALQQQLSQQIMPGMPGMTMPKKIADDADWSLLKIPRPQRDNIAAEIGITVEQFKNFFSNAKPKDRKKMVAKWAKKDDEMLPSS